MNLNDYNFDNRRDNDLSNKHRRSTENTVELIERISIEFVQMNNLLMNLIKQQFDSIDFVHREFR